MRSGPGDTAALFEDAASWQSYEANPYIEQRSRIVRAMIPEGVATVADVGCGNGVLIRSLADTTRAVGIDPSLTALRAFDLPRACGRGEALPLRTGSVDLVTCLEVLEHLPDDALRLCSAELARVTGRWLLVATPDREDPLRNAIRCPCCGTIFNRSHHLQRFDAERLASLFPGFDIRESRTGGQPVRGYPRSLLWLRHRIARRFYKGPGETRGLCPSCGNREFPAFRPNLPSVLLDGLNRLASRRRPYWVLLLLERRSGGSIGGDR
jgi:SAM-dependent methyltransferase